MEPLRRLLNRIRWDPEFGKAEFSLGYWDRVEGRILRVPLASVAFEEGNRFSFWVVGPDGTAHAVPLHRVRRVWRDGELIWSREPDAGVTFPEGPASHGATSRQDRSEEEGP